MSVKKTDPLISESVDVGGDFSAAPPKQPGLSQFISSATRSSTFGLFLGATSCCEKIFDGDKTIPMIMIDWINDLFISIS